MNLTVLIKIPTKLLQDVTLAPIMTFVLIQSPLVQYYILQADRRLV